MSKTKKTKTLIEESNHGFRKKRQQEYNEYLKKVWYEELRNLGLRDSNEEQGKSVYKEQQTDDGGDTQ